MNKLILIAFLIFSSCNESKTQSITYFLELHESEKWPSKLNKEFNQAINELTDSKLCFGLNTVQTECGSNETIKFAKYNSIEQLKPWEYKAKKFKILYYYEPENKNGEKLQRVLNSGGELNSRTPKNFILLWALK